MKITCFSIVEGVIDAWDRELQTDCRINMNKLEILHQYCDAIDSMQDDLDTKGYEAYIDRETNKVFVCIICPDLVLREFDGMFFELVEKSEKLLFERVPDDSMKITFVFPSVWGD